MPLLITDLDNTLYDWVTYYARAFRALVDVLVEDLGIDREVLLDEFKEVHQYHGDSEYPRAMFELATVKRKYAKVGGEDLQPTLDRAFRAFEASRTEYLKLYDGVASTLVSLRRAGVVIVGHTEALAENACFRLRHLDVSVHFRRLYALEGRVANDMYPFAGEGDERFKNFVKIVPRAERKPNPALVLDICGREGFRKEETWYVGDSLTRDVWMANTAGVHSVWARYGTHYDRRLWDSLVRVTHWTEEDVVRESELLKTMNSVKPDFVIDLFSELIGLMGVS